MTQPAEDVHTTSELSRRSIQLADLQEELDEGRERARQAEDRSAALERQIEKLKVEISVRNSKTQEMNDQVAVDEAVCQQNQRLLREAAEAAHAERSRLQAELAAAEAALEQAKVQAEARRAAEAAEQEDKRRVAEEAAQAEQLAAAEEAVQASQADVEQVQAAISELEVTLGVEKTSTQELKGSVAAVEEQRDTAKAECERLTTVLQVLSSKGELQRIREAIVSMRTEQVSLTQELSSKKRENLMQKQSIEGRLEETQRMLKDHLSETQRQLEYTSENMANSPLMASLQEAKRRAEAARERRLQAETDAKQVEKEVSETQGTVKQDQKDIEQEHYDSLKKELQGVQEDLEAARRRLNRSNEAAEASRKSLLYAQQASKQNVEVLRSKLQELWRGIQWLPA